MLINKISKICPDKLLDIGCGFGNFTSKLSLYCQNIKAIDSSNEFILKAKEKFSRPNIEYIKMDAKSLHYPDNSFDTVIERGTLHHVDNWKKVLMEMMRVSSNYVILSEPFYDFRSNEKKNTYEAQKLIIEVQREMGYSSFRYISLDLIENCFNENDIPFEVEIKKFNEIINFEDYFHLFPFFAKKTNREKYWLDRLEGLRADFIDKKLCQDDLVLFIAKVFSKNTK